MPHLSPINWTSLYMIIWMMFMFSYIKLTFLALGPRK